MLTLTFPHIFTFTFADPDLDLSVCRRRATEPRHQHRSSQENADRRNYYMDLAGIDHQPDDDDTEKLLNTSAPLIFPPSRALLEPQPSSHHQYRKKHRHRVKRDKRGQGSGLVKREVIVCEDTVDADLAILDNCVNKEIERTAEQVVLQQQLAGNAINGLNGGIITAQGIVTTTAAPVVAGVSLDQENCHPDAHTHAHSLPGHPAQPKVSLVAALSPKVPRRRPVSSPVPLPVPLRDSAAAATAHHERRHRHRDRQHQRAMQQVAAWIQHSVSPPPPDTDPGPQTLAKCPPATKLGLAGEHCLIQRHEHHHIHEHHHHHHYHHYHQT